MEQILTPEVKGQYKNLTLKTRYKREGKNVVLDENRKKIVLSQGLEDGNHIMIKKKFKSGVEIAKPTYTIYSCVVEYKGEDVSFIVYKADHEKFEKAGEPGDMVKISLTKEVSINPKTGAESLIEVLHFDKVEDDEA